MYTMDCKDPNCVKCKQASKGQISEEMNQCKILETVGKSSEEEDQRKLQKTVEVVIAKDLLLAGMAKGNCLSACRMLKEEVRCKIDTLIKILREREQELCIEIEKEYSAQVKKIDLDVTADCVEKVMRVYDGNKRHPSKTTLVFNSDFDALKRRLNCFGQLKYEDTDVLDKKMYQEYLESIKQWYPNSPLAEDTPSALSPGCLFEVDSNTSRANNTALASSASLVEVSAVSEYSILNEEEDEEADRQVKEALERLKEITLTTGKDLKIKYKDEVSEDLQAMSEAEKHAKRNHLKFRCQQRKEKENQLKLEATERKLILLNEKLMKELRADKITGRNYVKGDYFQIKKCGEDNSLGKEKRKTKTCHQQSTGRGEPEKLSEQIIKRFEMLANTAMEDQKREPMAYRIFTNIEVGKDSSSLQGNDRKLLSKLELMEKDLKEFCAKTPVRDLKKDKITSQSSESTDSLLSEEVEKDSSLDEDDIEIISKNETESIPSELSFSPPLPPKNRFKFGGRPRFGSLLRKKEGRKPPTSPRNGGNSESSGIGETESCESSVSCVVPSSGSNTVVKGNPSSNEQPGQGSSGECLGVSKDEGADNNPTVALRSSFTKYLEKNPESEWLAPDKSSGQPLPAGNSCKERVVPIFVQDLDQWLPAECNQKTASEWLNPARV